MTDRELFEKALEALTTYDGTNGESKRKRVLAALRERLAQPEQEPVAWVTGWHDGHCVIRAADPALMLPIGAALYTAPQRREWVGLTDDDLRQIILVAIGVAEAKLKEKNT